MKNWMNFLLLFFLCGKKRFLYNKKQGVAKLFCGEETFLKKGSLPHTPFSKNFHRNCFYYK